MFECRRDKQFPDPIAPSRSSDRRIDDELASIPQLRLSRIHQPLIIALARLVHAGRDSPVRKRLGRHVPHEAADGVAVGQRRIEPGFQALIGKDQRHAVVDVRRRAAGGLGQYRDARLAIGALGPDTGEEERLPILSAQKVRLLGFGAGQPLEPAVGRHQAAVALKRRLVELGGGHRLDSGVDRLRRCLPSPFGLVAPPHAIERQLRVIRLPTNRRDPCTRRHVVAWRRRIIDTKLTDAVSESRVGAVERKAAAHGRSIDHSLRNRLSKPCGL